MRDIVWTIIIVWVVWKIYDAFKNVSKTKTENKGFNDNQNNYQPQKEGEVKIDKNINQKTHINPDDAEYVDYEEIK